MNDGSQFPAGRNRVDLEAAGWLIRHDRGFTAAEQDEFLQWLAADPSHQEWFARHRQTWAEFNLLAHWRPEHSAEPNPDLLARRRRIRSPIWISSGALAAAASLALTWFFWPTGQEERRFPTEIKAESYEHRVLQDGSVVDLNSGTHLRVQFTSDERRVSLLQGEAQFTVKKNPARPFIVRAGKVDVRAVGTAFNVRLGGETVEVLVTEGMVQLDRPPAVSSPTGTAASGSASDPASAPAAAASTAAAAWQPTLIAGQLMVIPMAEEAPAPRVVAVSAADMSRLLAWQPQLLDFDSTPLSEVVAEFNRRNRTQLRVADDELLDLPIVASFRSDNVDGFVRLLEVTAQVRAERRGRNEIVLRTAGAAHQH